MSDLGSLHPIVVHFAIALLFVGVPLRLASLFERFRGAGATAVLLLFLGTAGSVVAVRSGDDAHRPAERIPGVRPLMHEHEEHGERARTIFLVVLGIEALAWGLGRREGFEHRQKLVAAACAVGVVGLFFLYEAAEHGGELVYSYAGGVGTRTGAPEDVGRLLLAGLVHQAQVDRDAGRLEDAARLIALAAERNPGNSDVALTAARSLLDDRNDPAAALDAARGIELEPETVPDLIRGALVVRSLVALERSDEARGELRRLQATWPESRFLARVAGELDLGE